MSAPIRITPTMTKLRADMITARGLADSSADLYMRCLTTLAGGSFRTLAFLVDVPAVEAKIADKALTTRKSYYAAAYAALSTKKTPQYLALARRYKALLDGNAEAIVAAAPAEGVKTAREAAAWMEWPEVLAARDALPGRKLFAGKSRASYTAAEWAQMTQYMLLCLYTMIEPRRVKDFQHMVVLTKKAPVPLGYTITDVSLNVLDMPMRRFVFNNYKTAKTYGQQIVPIPDELMSVLANWWRHHPLKRSGVPVLEPPLIVDVDGVRPGSDNYICRMLNAALGGRKISVSMLRHIYLSHRFGPMLEETAEAAAAMGHSTATQRTYIRAGAGVGDADKIAHE